MDNAKVEIANLVNSPMSTVVPIPVPSQVGKPLPDLPEPVERAGGTVSAGEDHLLKTAEELVEDVGGGVDQELQEKLDDEVDASPKGTIFIKIFENSPYEIDFSGIVTGSELDMAWRFMMKEYRVWKHTMFRKLEADKKDGGG